MLSLRKNLARLATVAVAAGGVTLAGTQVAWADNVVGVSPMNGTASATPFTISLPGTAKCSGDTATGGYHVNSYVVPSSVDPTTLNFASGAANQGQALIDTGGTPYDSEATGVASGAVQTLPQFSWSPYVGDFGTGFDLFPGTWNVGIACSTPTGAVDGNNFWNYQVTFSASGSSGDFSWQVVSSPVLPEAPLAIGLPLSALALAGAAAYVLRRRRRSASPADT
jgi:hypothetical protein